MYHAKGLNLDSKKSAPTEDWQTEIIRELENILAELGSPQASEGVTLAVLEERMQAAERRFQASVHAALAKRPDPEQTTS